MESTQLEIALDAVAAARERTERQIDALQTTVDAIVEAAELIATDDEHDPEGATIAYERAQAIALLRQARADLDALFETREQLERRGQVTCEVCAAPIALERVAALPTASRCVRCAS